MYLCVYRVVYNIPSILPIADAINRVPTLRVSCFISANWKPLKKVSPKALHFGAGGVFRNSWSGNKYRFNPWRTSWH